MKPTVDEYPFVLAGPILRRVESHAVSVFVALKEARDVEVRIYDGVGAADDDGPIAWHSGFDYAAHRQKTVALGTHLHVAVVTIRIPTAHDGQSIAGLQPDTTYGYNLFFHPVGGTDATRPSLRTASDLLARSVPIGFAPSALPSFALAPNELGAVNVVHGSCRKPHGEGTDMLAALDDYLRMPHSPPSSQSTAPLHEWAANRPHLLLLTGDQIYADDVDPTLLRMCHDAGRTLIEWHEEFPDTGHSTAAAKETLDALADYLDEIASDQVQNPPGATTGQTLQLIADAVVDDTRAKTLTRWLDAMISDLGGLLTAAGNAIDDPIRAKAEEIRDFLGRFGEIFLPLSTARSWGQAAVLDMPANRQRLTAIKAAMASPPEDSDAGAVLQSLAATDPPNTVGFSFPHVLATFHERLSQAVQGAADAVIDAVLIDIDAWINDPHLHEYLPSRISPPQRQHELKQWAALTSDAMTAHLMFLAEFHMMYLFAWSDGMWPRDASGEIRMPEFFESVPNYALTGPLSKPGLTESREALASFGEDNMHVRRVLANIPTLMMFDDHEVTDDWNLNQDWVQTVNGSVAGPQFLRNALASYAVFQDWGNRPDDYEPGEPGHQILDAIKAPGGTTTSDGSPPPPSLFASDSTQRDQLDALFGVGADVVTQFDQLSVALDGVAPGVAGDPVATAETAMVASDPDGYVFVKSDGRKPWHWNYQPAAAADWRIVCLDTRTHRAYPSDLWALRVQAPIVETFQTQKASVRGQVAAPNLIQKAMLDEQLGTGFDTTSNDSVVSLVISPAPVFGLPLVEDLFQRLSALSSGPEVADFEAWQGNPHGYEQLVVKLRGRQVILLSGDVHYGYSNILTFSDDDGNPVARPLVQLCSSSMKNETVMTKFIGHVGREGSLIDFIRFDDLGATYSAIAGAVENSIESLKDLPTTLGEALDNFETWFAETAPLLNPLNVGSWVTYYLAAKDNLLLDFKLMTPQGLMAVGGSLGSYFWNDLLLGSANGVYPDGNRTLRFLADDRNDSDRAERSDELTFSGGVPVLNPAWLSQQEEVVGFNNVGLLRFDESPGTTAYHERFGHELIWQAHDRRGHPLSGTRVGSTIHGYRPADKSVPLAMARIAKAEYERWGNGTIDEGAPAGLARIDHYYASLRSKNEALRAIQPPPDKTRIVFWTAKGGNGEILYWSATFISFVVMRAGAGEALFYSPRHIDYIRRAKHDFQNDPTASSGPAFHFLPLDHADAALRVGDMVVNWRPPSFTYADVETVPTFARRPAHVDIVVDLIADGSKAAVIGGNVSDTVKREEIDLDGSGELPAGDYIGILRYVRGGNG